MMRPDRAGIQTQDVVVFLTQIGRQVELALHARRLLLTELLNARRDPSSALARAGLAGHRCVRAFDDARRMVDAIYVPPCADECAFELAQWLDVHVEACDHLGRAAAAGDVDDLRQALRCLSIGARRARRFNDARQRLLGRVAAQSTAAS